MLLSKYNFYNFALPPIVEYYTKLTSFNIHFLGVNTNFAFYSLGVVYTKFVYRTLHAMPKIDMRGNISYIYELGELKLCALRRNRKFMYINAMRLRRSRQGFNGFLIPLFFWAYLRQATCAICAGIYTKLLFGNKPFKAFSYTTQQRSF